MKTSTFSNGHVDAYKGNRDVRAGWAIIDNVTGETVRSGHSLNEELARKAAQPVFYPGSISAPHGVRTIGWTAGALGSVAQRLRAAGHGNTTHANARQVLKAHNDAKRAEFWSRHRVEVVAV